VGSCIAGCSLNSLMFGLALTGFLQLGDWGWPAPLVPPSNSDGVHGWVVLALLLYICYHMSSLRNHELISFVGEGAQGCWSKMAPQLAEGKWQGRRIGNVNHRETLMTTTQCRLWTTVNYGYSGDLNVALHREVCFTCLVMCYRQLRVFSRSKCSSP
jgi:hypothetical protein